jgi:hypothetical protein
MSAPQEPDSHTRERTEVLLRLFQEYSVRACHYESQRATVGNIIIIGTVGLIGLIGPLDHDDWPLTLSIALIGVFGGGFTASYLGRIKRCQEKAKKHRAELSILLFKGRGNTLESLADVTSDQPVSEWRQPLKKAGFITALLWPLVITVIALGVTAYVLYMPAREKNEFTIHFAGPK